MPVRHKLMPLMAASMGILLIMSMLASAGNVDASGKHHKKPLLVVFDHKSRADKQQELIRSTGGDVRKDLRPLVDAVSLTVDESNLPQVKANY